MKKIILLFAIIFISQKINAQTNADCINAIPLCTTPSFTFFPTSGNGAVNDIPTGNNISNPTTNPASTNSGCLLSGENKPQWLLITIGNAGSLEFVFGAGTSIHPQAGYYDWAMWPYSSTTCNNIMNNTLAPIRCNWNAISSGGTGIASAANASAVGGNPGNFEPPLAVNACQQFIICISNYSGVSTLVSFQSLGSASLSCNPNCNPNYMICAGSNVTITPVNFAGLTNPTYSLNPGSLTNTTGNFVVSPLVTTTYTTYITGLNSSNVVQTTTALSTVTVNPQPAAAPTTTQSTCTNTNSAFNLGLTFNPSTPVPNYTITWSPIPNSVSSPTQTSGNGSNAPGLYNATITAAGGCSTTASFSLNPQPPPISFNLVPSGTSFTVTCANPTVVINLNPSSYSYTWTNGVSAPQNGSTGYFTSSNLGNWSVTGVNSSGCSSTQTFTVTQDLTAPTSTVTPVSQNITCLVTSVATFTAITTSTMTNVTQNWYSPYSPGAASSSGTISIQTLNAPGTYTECVVNNVNGCSVCKTVTVVSSASFPTVAVVSPNQFTIGCSTTSVGVISVPGVTTNPAAAGVTYTLLPPSYTGPTYTTNGTSIWNTTVPGQYTVIVHQISNGCETQIPVSVISNTFGPQITAAAVTPTLTCDVPKTVLQGTSTNTNVSYSWSFPGPPAGQVPNDTLTVFTNATPNNTVIGTYTLSITDNINLCKSTQTMTIYQNTSKPNAIMTGTNVLDCRTYSINLTNGSTSNVPATFFPTQPVIGYIWDGPSPQVESQLSTNYTAYTAGVYTLVVKDLNNGCTAIATKTIIDNHVYPIVNTPVGPPPFILDCAANGATISPLITGTTTGFTYSWVAVPTTSFTSYTSSVTVVDKPGLYRIFVTNQANGCVSSGNVEVINGGITANFNPSTTNGYAPLTVNFTNLSSSSSTASGTSSITSIWSFGNGGSLTTTSTNISPSTIYTQPGSYTVTLYVSKGTCSDTVSKVITVDIPSKLDVPNVFTPNGDGSNDVFFLKVANMSEINALIFDRWGNKVFESNSTTGNIEWDGKTMAGKDASVGTYFYIIKGTGKDGTSYDKKGNVSLYR